MLTLLPHDNHVSLFVDVFSPLCALIQWLAQTRHDLVEEGISSQASACPGRQLCLLQAPGVGHGAASSSQQIC